MRDWTSAARLLSSEAYARTFGDDRVSVVATEQLRTDPASAASTIASVLPCDQQAVLERLESRSPRNASPGRLGTAYQRAARRGRALRARLLTRDPDWTDPLALAELNHGVHGVAMRALRVVDRPPRPASRETDAALAAYYRDDNRLAAERTGLPLGGMGYAV